MTAEPGNEVAVPLIAQCLANIECRVTDRSLVKKYDLFVLEAVSIPSSQAPRTTDTASNGDGTFTVDGRAIDLKEKMILWKSFSVAL